MRSARVTQTTLSKSIRLCRKTDGEGGSVAVKPRPSGMQHPPDDGHPNGRRGRNLHPPPRPAAGVGGYFSWARNVAIPADVTAQGVVVACRLSRPKQRRVSGNSKLWEATLLATATGESPRRRRRHLLQGVFRRCNSRMPSLTFEKTKRGHVLTECRSIEEQ